MNKPSSLNSRNQQIFVRNLLVLLGFFILSVALSSCTAMFGDRPKDKPVELNDSKLDCISSVASDIKSWSASGQPAIEKPLGCIVAGLDKFRDRVRDHKAGEWTSSDIGHFLAESLDTPDGPSRIEAIMKIKQSLFGGATDVLTKDELNRARELLQRMKPEIQSLTPYLEILRLQVTHSNPDDAEEVSRSLSRISDILAEEVSHTGARPSISIDDVLSGMIALGFDQDFLHKYSKVAKTAKSLVAGGVGEQVTALEWPRVLQAAGRVWGMVLRIKYSTAGRQDLLGDDLKVVESIIHDGMNELEESARSQPGQLIEGFKLSALVDAMGELKLIPLDLSASTVKNLIKPTLGKILYGNSRPHSDVKDASLGLSQIEVFRTIADDWLESQKALTQAVRKKPASVSLIKHLRSTFGTAKGKSTATYLGQFAEIFALGRPLVHDSNGRFLVMSEKNMPDLSRSDLDETNLIRAFAAALMRGYSHSPEASDRIAGLNEEEVQELYGDMRGLGIEFGTIDIRGTGAGKRSYMEGRLFTSVPAMTDLVGIRQAVEWFEMGVGGNHAAADLHKSLLKTCGTSLLDVNGTKTLDIKCFRNHMNRNVLNIIQNLPGFAAWLKADASGERWKQSLFALEEAGRGPGAADSTLDEADTRSLLPILYYAENLFQTWDKNGNGILDKAEIWDFFPVIQPVLKKMGAGKADSEFVQKAIYSWIISKGSPPSTDFVGLLELGAWGTLSTAYDLKATRLDILKVMSSLAQFNRQSKITMITDFVNEKKVALGKAFETGDAEVISTLTDLFQCQVPARAAFADLMKNHVKELVPANGQIDPIEFTSKTKALILNDKRFAALCMPF